MYLMRRKIEVLGGLTASKVAIFFLPFVCCIWMSCHQAIASDCVMVPGSSCHCRDDDGNEVDLTPIITKARKTPALVESPSFKIEIYALVLPPVRRVVI